MLGMAAFLAACKNGSIARTVIDAGVPERKGMGSNLRTWARYPEKTDLMMLADRPPLLETPAHYFLQDLTPNDAYFVRWHYAGLPTRVGLRTFRTEVIGAANRPLQRTGSSLSDRPRSAPSHCITSGWILRIAFRRRRTTPKTRSIPASRLPRSPVIQRERSL